MVSYKAFVITSHCEGPMLRLTCSLLLLFFVPITALAEEEFRTYSVDSLSMTFGVPASWKKLSGQGFNQLEETMFPGGKGKLHIALFAMTGNDSFGWVFIVSTADPKFEKALQLPPENFGGYCSARMAAAPQSFDKTCERTAIAGRKVLLETSSLNVLGKIQKTTTLSVPWHRQAIAVMFTQVLPEGGNLTPLVDKVVSSIRFAE